MGRKPRSASENPVDNENRAGNKRRRTSPACGYRAACGGLRVRMTVRVMSALPPKADMCGATRDVRFGPKADSCTAATASLFDHFVRCHKQRLRHFEAECLRGFEVDDQLKLSRLHDRQVRWLRTVENATDRDARLVLLIDRAGAVADQAASSEQRTCPLFDNGTRRFDYRGIPIVRLRLDGQFAFKTTDTRIQQIEVSRMYRLINLTQNAPGPGQERFTCGMSLNMIHDTLPLFRLMRAFTCIPMISSMMSFLRVYAHNSARYVLSLMPSAH